MRREPPSLEMITDASLTVGWGAVLGDLRTGGPWLFSSKIIQG